MQTPSDTGGFDSARTLPDVSRPFRMGTSVTLGAGAMLIAILGFGIWATTVPIASAIVAHGTVMVASKRKQVQHLEGGIVKGFAVKDGDQVKEGDVLIEFDGLRTTTRLAVMRAGYFSSLAVETRLTAERDDRNEIVWPSELQIEASTDSQIAAMLNSQVQLFEARRTERAGQKKILEARMDRLKDEINGHQAESAASARQLEMAQEEQKTLEELFGRKHTTRTRVLSIRREVFQLEGNIGRLTSQIAAANKEIGETELNLAQINKKDKTEILAELREVQSKVLDLREHYTASKGEAERTFLRATASGTVIGSQVHTVGGVLRGGETLLEIVPNNDHLVIEVRLRPQDVDNVEAGQSTEVRLTAFKQRTTPPLQGRVAVISADTVTNQRTQETYYLASIEISGEEQHKLGGLKLQPGMPAEALIKTGTRTAMTYLMEPLSESLNRAWREN